MTARKLLTRIRYMVIFFIVALVLSGVTAFPVYSELKWMIGSGLIENNSMLGAWLFKVWYGVQEMMEKHEFLFYGYDWLAFAHLVIAMAFIGPYRDPVKNIWVIEWAILACIAVIPLAVIAGPIRQIPWFHIVIDCMFGVLGLIPLLMVRKWIKKLSKCEDVKI